MGQAFDHDGNVVDSMAGADEVKLRGWIDDKLAALQRGEVAQVRVASIPAVGEVIEQRGLKYRVTHSGEDFFRAEVVKP